MAIFRDKSGETNEWWNFPQKMVIWALLSHFSSKFLMIIDKGMIEKSDLNNRILIIQIEIVETKVKLWLNYMAQWWNLCYLICTFFW